MRQTSRHRGSNAQSFVNSAEVVMREVKRNCCLMVLNLLRETIGARKRRMDMRISKPRCCASCLCRDCRRFLSPEVDRRPEADGCLPVRVQ